MKVIYLAIITLLISGCASPNQKPEALVVTSTSTSPLTNLVRQGNDALAVGNLKNAIALFDQVITQCEETYSDSEEQVYTARTSAEGVMYSLLGIAKQQNVQVIAADCSDAYYYKAYIAVELQQADSAEAYINKAVAMAPYNAMYLAELGYIYQLKGQWKKALATFTRGEDEAVKFSPAQLQQEELLRLKRGVGYTLIEMGRLTEATEKFNECLAIEPENEACIGELQYIESLRTSQ